VQGEEGREEIVGHVPLTLSHIFHLFLKHGGKIAIRVSGKQRNKGICLEISATYTFQHKKPSKVNNLIALFKDKEDKTSL